MWQGADTYGKVVGTWFPKVSYVTHAQIGVPITDEFMNVKEVAAYTGVSPSVVSTAASTGRLSFKRIGQRRYFTKEQVDEWRLLVEKGKNRNHDGIE